MRDRQGHRIPIVVGVGELLWDVLPQGKRPGGAPANFVFYCGQLGADAYIASSLGNDDLGNDMRDLLAHQGFKLDFVTTSRALPTSTVSVSLDQDQNPHYRIKENVAWDEIPWSERLGDLSRMADAVCFGSLAQRSPLTRQTIHKFLACAGPECLRVFDVNLRLPYPDFAVLLDSIEKANVVKLNADELEYVGNPLGLTGDTHHRLAQMVRRFDLICIALTRGAHGSILVTSDEIVECPGQEILVRDTVGAGDAFTAGMVMGLLQKRPLHEVNTVAGCVAACACSQAGAMARLSPDVTGSFGVCGHPVREYRTSRQNREKTGEFEAQSRVVGEQSQAQER